jgi:hypothetical protein
MTRKQFNALYREARVCLRGFTDMKHTTPESRDRAETQWQHAVQSFRAPAYLACVGRLSPPKATLSQGALYAYKHGFYYTDRTSWQGWVREKLARREAA